MKQIVCSNCLSRVDASAASCPYCGQSFANTNPAGALPVNTLLAGRYTLGKCAGVDGEGVIYHGVDGDTGARVLVKEYVPFTICSARAADGRVIPRAGREVLFKTTRMDFIDLYQSLKQLGAVEGLVRVLDLIEANDTAYAVREPDEGVSLTDYLDELQIPLTCDEALICCSPWCGAWPSCTGWACCIGVSARTPSASPIMGPGCPVMLRWACAPPTAI